MHRFMLLGISSLICLTATGCVTVGRPLPGNEVPKIIIAQTSREDIERKFGQPFRTGIDSGDPSTTYLYYHFHLFRKPITTDLKIVYSANGKVKSYVYDSNEEEQE